MVGFSRLVKKDKIQAAIFDVNRQSPFQPCRTARWPVVFDVHRFAYVCISKFTWDSVFASLFRACSSLRRRWKHVFVFFWVGVQKIPRYFPQQPLLMSIRKSHDIPSLKPNSSAPENTRGPKRKVIFQPSYFQELCWNVSFWGGYIA